MPEEDRATYAEGMHRGGTIVSVTADAEQAEKAADILEEQGSVDLDEREANWRKEGWAGWTPDGTDAHGAAKENSIPIVDEQLRVGTRQVAGGRVKVRSYAIETPVEEQVKLREETVSVERRPADRRLTSAESAEMFKARAIEAEERDEEAVVEKEARLKEELVVGKTVQDRTQTIKDKVRHTEVDVEDERAGRSASGRGRDR